MELLPEQTNTHPQVTFQQLLDKVKNDRVSVTSLKKRDTEAEQEIRERETEREGRKKYFALRDKWSKYLFVLLTIMISFQVILTFFIGFGWSIFAQYEKFLYLVIGENFLQITGMCIIVVRFLFPQNETKSP
jgi:hypothetical protein